MKIRKLQNVNSKSFQNYTLKSDLKPVNIFFGTNGVGKSALVEYLKSKDEKARIFDTDFVNNDLLFENSEKIKGVKLTVGRENIKNQNELNELKKKQEQLNSNISNIQLQKKQNSNTLENLIDQIVDQGKKNFKAKHIRRRAVGNPVKAYKEWIKEEKIENIDNINEINDIEDKEELLNKREDFYKNLSLNFSEKDQQDLHDLLLYSVSEPGSADKPDKKRSADVLNWLYKGEQIHHLNDSDETEICQFCGNPFNIKHIYEKIENIKKDEYSNFSLNLDNLNKKINSNLEELDKIKNSNDLPLKEVEAAKKSGETNLHLLEKKKKSNGGTIRITDNFFEKIKNLKIFISEEIRKIEKKRKEYQKIELENDKYAKSWIAISLSNNKVAQNLVYDIKDSDKNIKEIEDQISSIKTEVQKIKSLNTDLEPFQQICNGEFKSIGIDLKIEIEDKGYVVQNSKGLNLKLQDLSEGEQRLIAFFYFYYSLFTSEDNFNETISNIIIDDPITSLDSENQYEIIEDINQLIRLVVKDKYANQLTLFVLTNSSYAYNEIGYGVENGIARWEIYKDDKENSNIRKWQKKDNYNSYYRRTFQAVLEFALKGKDKLKDIDNPLPYCNQTRIIIEAHAFSNYKLAYVTSKQLNQVAKYYNIEDKHKKILRQYLDIINANSHGFSYLDDLFESGSKVNEIQKAVRGIISILYLKDKWFVISMIDKDWKQHQKEIENCLKEWAEIWK